MLGIIVVLTAPLGVVKWNNIYFLRVYGELGERSTDYSLGKIMQDTCKNKDSQGAQTTRRYQITAEEEASSIQPC
jgi:hypothetical protein